MATANPLDEFLNSEVDEYAISALVGSLTNELASPTSMESLQQKSASNSQKNHVDGGQTNVPTGARTADVQTVQDGQKAGLNVNSGLHAGNPSTVNKTVADNRLLGLNTVVTGPNATGRASIVTINNTAGSQTGHVSVGGSVRIGQIQTCRGSDSPSPNSAGSPGPVNNVLLQQMRSVPSPNTNSGISRTPPPATIITTNQNNNNKAQILRDQMDTDSIGVGSNVPKTQFVIKQEPHVKIPISVNTTRGSPVSIVTTGVSQRQSPLTANTSQITSVAQSPQSRPQTVLRTSVTTSPHVQIMNSPRMAVTSTQLKTLAPRLVNTGSLRIQQPQQIIAPRTGTNTITIPTGMVPPNAVFIKNEQGQIVMVTPSSQGSIQSQTGAGATPVSTMGQKIVIQPRGQMASTILRHPQTITSAATPPTIRQAIPQAVIHQSQQGSNANAQAQFENVKKCKNFLTTLIKLASSQPKKTVENVKTLIQGLIDGGVEPEMFTTKLQFELKSSPQPYLVPFLKKSLPLLRHSLSLGKMAIEGVTAPLLASSRASTVAQQSQVINQLQVGRASNNSRLLHAPGQMPPLQLAQQRLPAKNIGVNKNLLFKPGAQLPTHHPSPLQLKEKRKYDSLKDDDDINDVATMGGVNLTEESRNILASNSEIFGAQTRSCKDEYFLNTAPLLNRISNIAKKHGLSDVPTEVAHLVSHAAQERLRNLMEKLGTISEHRLEVHKMDQRFEATDESRLQMKFLEELDKLEKKRHEDSEREILLRAAKSRSKHEDPEQLKLKQKAKELQQMEMEEVRQREANLTALAAIGPRKKRKTEPVNTSQGGPDIPSNAASSSSSSSQRNALRPRAKRVNLRDLIFLLEQERESAKSNLLYQTYLK